MNFASDNTHPAHPAIMAALNDANHGVMASYGADPLTKQAEQALQEVFDCDLKAFLVMTGSAANGLALSTMTAPYGAVLCHEEAHIIVDECGGPELLSGGAKLLGLKGDGGKITPEGISASLNGLIRGEHDPKPQAVSITQATEFGTVYTLDEISAISELAHERGLKVHMDGARFANALVALGVTPAQMSWQAGIDALSFGATKNGAMMLEAVIFFNTALAQDFEYRRMRAGQLLSKGRYLAAQMLGYLKDDLWLENASHANEMAKKLSHELLKIADVRLCLPVIANEVFIIMKRDKMDELLANGAQFHEWPGGGPGNDTPQDGEVLARFVTSYATTDNDISQLIKLWQK